MTTATEAKPRLLRYTFEAQAPDEPFVFPVLVMPGTDEPLGSFSQERLKACDVVAFHEAIQTCELLGTELLRYVTGPDDYEYQDPPTPQTFAAN